ncbi:BQ2448_2905 [Microbotryum intermedium]|uniref:polynucleotide adenylyltransferase n=1 Tax=Microbotryum intermedium TaxID=269621 RepID=A0A238FDP7_9BASI|nr:BQ2448_2905 [Microbotryum intermedium]
MSVMASRSTVDYADLADAEPIQGDPVSTGITATDAPSSTMGRPSKKTRVDRGGSAAPAPAPIPSPSSSSSSSKATASTPTAPARSGNSSSLFSKAVHGAMAQAQASTTTPRHAPADSTTRASKSSAVPEETASTSTLDTAARAQFEQQMDFISFDFDSDENAPLTPSYSDHRGGARSRGTPSRSNRSSRATTPTVAAHKRKLDEYEQRRQDDTSNLRRREKGRTMPWCENPGVEWDKATNAIEITPFRRLNLEAHAFIEYISPSPIEHELRIWTIELVRRTIQSMWPDADVECFGSVGTGLYLPGGDIDLVVLCPTMPAPPLKPSSALLHRIASLLLHSSLAEPTSLVVIAKARVPILKFVTRFGGFSVDLSVNQESGVEAAVRVRQMLEDYSFREAGYVEPGSDSSAASSSAQDDRSSSKKNGGDKGKGKGKDKMKEQEQDKSKLEDIEAPSLDQSIALHIVDHGVARSLVLLLKAFLNQRGMNEVFTGGLGSYSIICLVISFLQVRIAREALSYHTLHADVVSSRYKLHPKMQVSTIVPSRNIGLLFVELLDYYGRQFNFDLTGITLRHRGGYFNKHDKGWYRPNQPYLLSIEDPNDPLNDVSGGSHGIVRVRQTLSGGYESLTATIYQRVSVFNARRDAKEKEGRKTEELDGSFLPIAIEKGQDPLRTSILGSIIGMTSAAIEARRDNLRLYEQGVLQDLLKKVPPGGVKNPMGSNPGQGLTKKQMKKLRKEVRQQDKREKTRMKLERRSDECKAKKIKKMNEKMGAGSGGAREEFVVDVVGDRETAGNVETIDLRGEGEDDNDDEEESRYAITSPNPQRPSAIPTPTVYIGGSSDEDASEDDDGESSGSSEHDDQDVMLGGSGGDVLVGALASRASSSKRPSPQPLPLSSTFKKGAASNKSAKAAFWAAKGLREEREDNQN